MMKQQLDETCVWHISPVLTKTFVLVGVSFLAGTDVLRCIACPPGDVARRSLG